MIPIFWAARSKTTGKLEGNGRVQTPRLYFTEKQARAAFRRYRETDEALDQRLSFIRLELRQVP